MLSVNGINLLQAQNEGLKKQNVELQKDYAELKAENERLKEEIKNNKSAYQVELGTYNMECSNLLEENKELAHYLACMTEQRNKANTCLQEIKAIAEEWMKDYCYLDNFKDEEGCSICHENKDCYSYRLLKALTKAEEE